ncbi:MAG: hypothetical protein IIB13_05745, partial [Chloroflexi bacterium]|nr:hypothetical protein [Chloroflexota bacterium]
MEQHIWYRRTRQDSVPHLARARRLLPMTWGLLLTWGGLLLGVTIWGAPGEAETILVPRGPAVLGSDEAEKAFGYEIGGAAARRWKWFHRERRREIELPAYRIDLTLVTQDAYKQFVRATGHPVPYISEVEYRHQGFLVHPYEEVLPYLWRTDRPPAGLGGHPVVLVSQP